MEPVARQGVPLRTQHNEQRRDRDSNPGHLNGATAFETAALPLCHPANNTTIALVPATRKHSGGDEHHGAVTTRAQKQSLVTHHNRKLTVSHQKLL